jgi:hypothetical protein
MLSEVLKVNLPSIHKLTTENNWPDFKKIIAMGDED